MARKPKIPIYIFGWPSYLGGADTKLAHLLGLLHRHYQITVIPNDGFRLKEPVWSSFMQRLGIRCCVLKDLPKKLTGYAVSFCNTRFLTDRIAERAKERGLKVIWSGEMAWCHPGEVDAVKAGVIDQILYASDLQRQKLQKHHGDVPGMVTGNYIDPRDFNFRQRRNKTFTIGRLSRPDPEKYPEDFPVFYEALELPDARFRVMAWDRYLAWKYRWHTFDERWDLLKPMQETQKRFLWSLDLFVYSLGQNCVEVWGRAVVEAMLTGCIPLVPAGHYFEQLVVSGKTGFICSDFQDYQSAAQQLFHDTTLRQSMSRACRDHALAEICNPAHHLAIWKKVFV